MSVTATVAGVVQAENDRAEEAAYRKDSKTSFEKLLSVNADGVEKYDERQRRALREALDSLISLVEPDSNVNALEEYRKRHPDLYDKLARATSLNEVDKIIDESILRQISKAPECGNIRVEPYGAGTMGGVFTLRPLSAFLYYLLAGRGVAFTMTVFRGNQIIDARYRFLFADGSSSPMLQCKNGSGSCRDGTTDASTRQIYQTLQQKLIVGIDIGDQKIEVEPSLGDLMRRTFSCIAPE